MKEPSGSSETMHEYWERVKFYFQSEYSDYPLMHLVERIRVCHGGYPAELVETTLSELNESDKRSALRKRWSDKIDQVITVYYKCGKHPSEAARKLADLLQAYTQQQLIANHWR